MNQLKGAFASFRELPAEVSDSLSWRHERSWQHEDMLTFLYLATHQGITYYRIFHRRASGCAYYPRNAREEKLFFTRMEFARRWLHSK